MLLEGLKQLFHQAGGVPTHLRIDNLSAAVITIGKGENRIYTEAFLQFQMHYNFETQPCNPYSGHEKVMLSVKLVIHVIIGLQLHRLWKVFTTCTVARSTSIRGSKRPHYDKKIMIEELWNDDKNALKPLPLEDLSVFSLDTTTVNKYGEITVDQERFVLRKTNVKQVIVIKRMGSIYMFYF